MLSIIVRLLPVILAKTTAVVPVIAAAALIVPLMVVVIPVVPRPLLHMRGGHLADDPSKTRRSLGVGQPRVVLKALPSRRRRTPTFRRMVTDSEVEGVLNQRSGLGTQMVELRDDCKRNTRRRNRVGQLMDLARCRIANEF